jgi:hypothetical protein
VRDNCDGPRMIIGDVNMIYLVEDKNNANINSDDGLLSSIG